MLMQSAGLLIICHMREETSEQPTNFIHNAIVEDRFIGRIDLTHSIVGTVKIAVKPVASVECGRPAFARIIGILDARQRQKFPQSPRQAGEIIIVTETRPSFYILDAFNLIFQVFHAIPEMTGPAGQPTQAVFGIYRDLLNLVRDRKPDYVAAAFDGPGPVFRSDIYQDYKANRKEMPVDLVPQIPVIRRLFEGFRIPVIIESGMEADDIIATLTRRAEERGYEVFIVTADKDARQLISDQVRILNLRKNKLIDAAELEKEWGIRPDQVVDFLALTGDTVDNVPGVPGIGEGFASTFLKQFGTLDQLLANVGQVKGPKKQQSLREHADTARRARLLVKLRDDLPLELDWDALKTQPMNVEALKALCTECGFHRFRDELSAQPRPTSAQRRGDLAGDLPRR